MKSYRRFYRFLKSEGVFSEYLIRSVIDPEGYLRDHHPALAFSYRFFNKIGNIDIEQKKWRAINCKWLSKLSKDYTRKQIVSNKLKRVHISFIDMLEKGNFDEVCHFFSSDVNALETSINKLSIEINK